MKILVVGGTGTVGSAVVAELARDHEVVVASSSSAVKVDIHDVNSINAMYKAVGPVDAVISALGSVAFKPLTEMTAEDFQVGLQNKLMGQVNLVLQGFDYVSEGGSFTLTSGVLSDDPIFTGSSASMVNAALNSWVMAAAIEMPKRQRINCVSPTLVTESKSIYGDYFKGFKSVSAADVALAFRKSVDGLLTGKVLTVFA